MGGVASYPRGDILSAYAQGFSEPNRVPFPYIGNALVKGEVNPVSVLREKIDDVKPTFRRFCHRPIKHGNPWTSGPVSFAR